MTLWQRRTLGILTLGGGAVGVTVTLTALLATASVLTWIIIIAFAAIYAWGTWIGLQLIESQPKAEHSALTYWILQVPVLGSPVVSYQFANGFLAIASLQLAPVKLNGHAMIGSQFNFALLQLQSPWLVGVNLFALGVCWWLARCIKAQPQRPPAEPAA